MILIHTHSITPRVKYIFNLIFSEMLNVDWALSDDPGRTTLFEGAVINYSPAPLGEALHFMPHGLLQESGTKEQETEVFQWEGLPVFFRVAYGGEWPFDPFAMIFFMVSRYEEYLKFIPDEHGRFPSSASLASKNDFLHLPLANMVVHRLKESIIKSFPGFHFQEPEFLFHPTFDIDIAFAHRGKGLVRSILGSGKLFLKGKWTDLNERLAVWLGLKHDPYDNFDFQLAALNEAGLSPKYFALIGDFGTYDRNLSQRSRAFQKLLKRLPGISLHHSYRSYGEPERILMEKKRLEKITGREITETRAHFLRFRIPDTYMILPASGITDDYSMGYSDVWGFRAGIAGSFLFYDLIAEQQTELRIHTFAFMDTAFCDKLGLNPRDALQKVTTMKEILEQCGGEMTGIWHNYALGDTGRYEGWQEFFLETINLMRDSA